MRRLLFLTAAIALIACNSDSLLPAVMTADGQWTGTQNGIAVSFNLSQVDSNVAGSTALSGVFGGSFAGTASGTFIYPTLHLNIQVTGFEDVTYDGTMSASNAVIAGVLNGSGFANTEIDVHKQ